MFCKGSGAHLETVAAGEDWCGVVSAPHNRLRPNRTTTLTSGSLRHRNRPHPAAIGKRLPSHPAAIGKRLPSHPAAIGKRLPSHAAAIGKRLPSHAAAIGMPETRVQYGAEVNPKQQFVWQSPCPQQDSVDSRQSISMETCYSMRTADSHPEHDPEARTAHWRRRRRRTIFAAELERERGRGCGFWGYLLLPF